MKLRIFKIIILSAFIVTSGTAQSQSLPSFRNQTSVEPFRGSVQFFLVRAENFFRQGNQLDALLELDNAVNLAPYNPEVYLHRAMLKYRLGMSTEAQKDAEMAVRLNPIGPALFGINGPKAQMDLLAFYPEELFQTLSWEQHLAYYESTLDRWYADLIENTERNNFSEIESSILYFEEALLLLQDKAFEVALEELGKVTLPESNTSIVFDLKGLIYLEMEEIDLAANAFRKAISLDPNNATAWYNFSKMSQHLSEDATALDFLNKAIGLNPTLDKAYFERAMVKKKLGDLSGAVADYSKIINRAENAFLSAYFNRAICYKKMGKLTAAINDLDYLITFEPDNPLTWKMRGNINLLSGRHNEAIADFTKAIELNSDLGTAYFNRGVAHLLNHNPITACGDFERSADEGYERAVEKQRYFCSN